MARRMLTCIALTVTVLTASGCATAFHGSAPAVSPDKQFVVGSFESKARVWVCSQKGPDNGDNCRTVEVQE